MKTCRRCGTCYLYNEDDSAIEWWNLAVCDKMDEPEGIMLSEISHIEKDKYNVISVKCGI